MTANEFRMRRVQQERAGGPGAPRDLKGEAETFLRRGDDGDMDTTLLHYGAAEARAALFQAQQVARQTEVMEAQLKLMEMQTAALTAVATAVTRMAAEYERVHRHL